jgi:hypothetical protein
MANNVQRPKVLITNGYTLYWLCPCIVRPYNNNEKDKILTTVLNVHYKGLLILATALLIGDSVACGLREITFKYQRPYEHDVDC